jgi:hypothetical protein
MTHALLLILLMMGSTFAGAQQFGTADEARAMLDRAIAALKSNEAMALKEINNTNNKQFHDRDLYVSCFSTSDGKFTAFPSPDMIGMDVRTLTFDNDPIGQRAYDALQGIPEGNPLPSTIIFLRKESPQ